MSSKEIAKRTNNNCKFRLGKKNFSFYAVEKLEILKYMQPLKLNTRVNMVLFQTTS